MGTQTPAAFLRAVVLNLRVPRGIFDILRDAVRAACALRPGHGRGVGRRNASRARALAGETARTGFRVVARRVVLGISVLGSRVSVCLSAVLAEYRMACHVLDRDT